MICLARLGSKAGGLGLARPGSTGPSKIMRILSREVIRHATAPAPVLFVHAAAHAVRATALWMRGCVAAAAAFKSFAEPERRCACSAASRPFVKVRCRSARPQVVHLAPPNKSCTAGRRVSCVARRRTHRTSTIVKIYDGRISRGSGVLSSGTVHAVVVIASLVSSSRDYAIRCSGAFG